MCLKLLVVAGCLHLVVGQLRLEPAQAGAHEDFAHLQKLSFHHGLLRNALLVFVSLK